MSTQRFTTQYAQLRLPATQASQRTHSSDDFHTLHSRTNTADALSPIDATEHVDDLQSNVWESAQGAASSSQLKGLGILFEGFDPFARPMPTLDPPPCENVKFSPIFDSSLPYISSSISAPDFPDAVSFPDMIYSDSDDNDWTVDALPSSPLLSADALAEDPSLSWSPIDVENLANNSPYTEAFPCHDWTSAANSPLVGLFPDVNMRDFIFGWTEKPVGIDPARLTVSQGTSPAVVLPQLSSLVGSSVRDVMAYLSLQKAALSPLPAVSPAAPAYLGAPHAPAAASSFHGPRNLASTTARSPTCAIAPIKLEDISSDVCLSSPIALASTRASPTPAANGHNPVGILRPAQWSPSPPASVIDLKNVPLSPETPVFHTHLGINVLDLQRRAERYRRHNPGQEIERPWLLKYAGKKTCNGSPMQKFRCYVSGCTQTNKRRDHIVVHVGSHVGERPFACAYCPTTFLRRNERKRHEAKHLGLKPYVCDLCTEPAMRFGRQDLLSRHLKRIHGVDPTAPKRVRLGKRVRGEEDDAENAGLSTRKRARACEAQVLRSNVLPSIHGIGER